VAHCKKCNRELARGERRSEHVCDTVKLSDGRITHRSRLEGDPALREKIDSGELKVVERAIADPLRSVKDKFGKKLKRDPETGAVLLGKD
jgi:hypothetical protein